MITGKSDMYKILEDGKRMVMATDRASWVKLRPNLPHEVGGGGKSRRMQSSQKPLETQELEMTGISDGRGRGADLNRRDG